MAIFNDFIIKINNDKAILNRDIYLTRGDKNVDLLFTLNGFNYKFSVSGNELEGCSSSQICLLKPNGEIRELTKSPLENGKIKFIISSELIDEFIEVGNYSFQIVLFDESGCEVRTPIIYNQIHVSEALSLDSNSNKVNDATINVGHISTESEIDVFNDTKGYNKTDWSNGQVITDAKLNKIENAIGYSIDNVVVYRPVVGNVLTLGTDKYQSSQINANSIVKLPSIDYMITFTLFMNATKECIVTFQSTSDNQQVTLEKGYHELQFSHPGDWLIKQ